MSTADELRAELARLEQDQPVSGEVVDGHGGIQLVVRGESFECRRVSTSWQMMQFAKAQRESRITVPKGLPEDSPKRKELEERRNNAGMRMMALLLDTCMILLKPGERQRFEDFMDAASADDEGLESGELENAIGDVIAAAGGEQGKAEPIIASQSSVSSGTTNENVRVISFNKDGAETSLPDKVS
jgi:hypothetical protein